ncbi:MAG: hypothetical protein F7B20_04485 [Aeropyrum sp.]|nr:hypothetical protein [Aeropyrum sp.]MCE4615844.1 hypothetical protein [Aeropyrum sp.]
MGKGGSYLDPLVEVLSYFVAKRNYGYVDILTNALDRITVLEAIINAIRDFEADCASGRPQSEDIRCPEIPPEKLSQSVEEFQSKIEGLSGAQLMELARSLSLRALARGGMLRKVGTSGESAAS